MELLYHCFPRRASPTERANRDIDDTLANRLGIEILESLMRFGLLLTPECLEFPGAVVSADCKPTPPLTVTQSRACFTLFSRHGLLEQPKTPRYGEVRDSGDSSCHLQQFGEFAVGIDPVEARVLGVMPVFYYYQLAETDERLANVMHHARELDLRTFGPSSEIVERLGELRTLMCALAYVESLGAPNDRPIPRQAQLGEFGIDLSDEPEALDAVRRLGVRTARKLFKCVDTHRMPAWNLIEWIDIILSLFQRADEKNECTSLRYFRQREWRIVQMYSPQVECWPLQKAEAFGFCDSHEEMWEGQDELIEVLNWHSHAQRYGLDMKHTYILSGALNRKFRDFIREIIVPSSCRDDAEGVLRKCCVSDCLSWEIKSFGPGNEYSVFELRRV